LCRTGAPKPAVTTAQRYPPYVTVDAGGRELAALLECHPTFGLHVVHHERTQETHHNLATICLYDGLIQTKIKM
jgi:hypothetical protein